MKRLFSIAALLLTVQMAGEVWSAETVKPTVLILYTGDIETAFMDHLRERLEAQTTELELEVTVTTKRVPLTQHRSGEFSTKIKQIQRPRGTVGVMGLSCSRRRCELSIFPPKGEYHAKLIIDKTGDDPEARLAAVTATIREALVGPLLPEMKRLTKEGETPSPLPSLREGVLLSSPFESNRKETTAAGNPWLWISAGYHGDHPHPSGHPIHGPFVGVDLVPTSLLGVGFSMGWLGIRRAEVEGASASVHRMDTTLALRLLFPLGPATISVSVLGRLDVAFATMHHGGGHPEETETRIEAQTGGLTMWHLPLPGPLNAWVGAGVLVSLRSEEVSVYVDENSRATAIDGSTVRMIWCAGVAFSPFAS